MNPHVVQGDLLDQDVDVIVNAWNRNIIPWWLLLPQGVSGAIKRRGGLAPFKELAKHGPIPLGGAVLTSAGRLPFKGIIHVAGINILWRASEWSIRHSVRNAVALAQERGFDSIAFPLIGAGSGGFNQERAKAIMEDELGNIDSPMDVRVVVFREPQSFSAYDSNGRRYIIVISNAITAADATQLVLRTDDGVSVDRIGKGEYRIMSESLGYPHLTTDDPNWRRTE